MDPDITAEQLMQMAEAELAQPGAKLAEVQGKLDQAAKALGLGSGPGGGLGEALRLRVEARREGARVDPMLRVAEQGRTSAAMTTFLNTLTLGQMGGLLERFGPEGTSGEEFREGMRDIRTAQPIPTAATELGTGLALPVGGSLMNVGRTLGTRVAGGAVTGGAMSGLFGFGEASGTTPERLEEAAGAVIPGAVFGGVAGAFARPTRATGEVSGRAFRGRRGANKQLGSELQETTGLSRDINPQLAAARAETKRVSEEFFQPLDEAFPEVRDPQIDEFMEELTNSPDARSTVRAVSADLLVPAENASEAVVARSRGPSFDELQDLRNRLWRQNSTRDSGDELQGIMEEVFPRFREGNARFRAAKDIEDAFALGSGEISRTFRGERIRVGSVAQVDEALRVLPVESHEAFRTGLLQRTINRISRPETGVASDVRMLRELIDDVDTNGKLRGLFPNDRLAEEFQSLVRQEKSARILRRALVRAGIGAVQIAALGAALTAGAALLD